MITVKEKTRIDKYGRKFLTYKEGRTKITEIIMDESFMQGCSKYYWEHKQYYTYRSLKEVMKDVEDYLRRVYFQQVKIVYKS